MYVAKYLLPANFSKDGPLGILYMEFAFNTQLQCILSGYKPSIGTQNYQPIDSEKIRLEYEITVYSNYAGPKYEQFEQNLVNSVKAGTFVGLRHVAALLNTIYCNIQPFLPVISNALAK